MFFGVSGKHMPAGNFFVFVTKFLNLFFYAEFMR